MGPDPMPGWRRAGVSGKRGNRGRSRLPSCPEPHHWYSGRGKLKIERQRGSMRLNQGMQSKLTYANVVSTLALCFAVGGGFAVAGTLVGNSKDVAPQAIKNSDVKKNTLTSNRLKDGAAVSANDVIPDALGGAAIDESSLGDAPSALSAQSATNATNAENAANATTRTPPTQRGPRATPPRSAASKSSSSATRAVSLRPRSSTWRGSA